MKNALIIFRKEVKEVIKNKHIWLPVLILTLIFSIAFPLSFTLFSDSLISDENTIDFINKTIGPTDVPIEKLMDFIVRQLLIFLLMIPSLVSSLISAASIIMEKENNTLEPLLATPVKTSELLFGKTLTALIPAFIISTINFVLLTIMVDIGAYIKFGFIPLPTVEWAIVALIISPLLTFIIIMLGVIVSARTADIRSAQAIGSIVIFPIYLLIGLQITGYVMLNITYLLLGGLVLLVICPLLLRVAIKIFDRENILTKWKMK